MKSWFLGQASVLVVALTAVGIATPSSARAGWTIEVIDASAHLATSAPSLAVDADGNPHVVYPDCTFHELRYAKRVGGAWQTEIVPADPYHLTASALALDSQDRPHIAYFGADPYGLYYVHWTGTEWQSSYVLYGTNYVPALALTTTDEPRIAFQGHSDLGDALWYAFPSEASWSWEHVSGSGYGCCGYSTALALDANDSPQIGWAYAGYLVYAWGGGEYPWPSEWIGQNVDCYSANLVLDTADQPHAVFVQAVYGSPRDLIYARRIDSAWSFETVAAPGAWARLVLDADDHPHVAYLAGSWESPGPLMYAHRTTSSWCVQTLDPAGCGRPTIAVDPAGNPHIVYYEGTNLKYAWWEPSIVTGDLNGDGCVNFGDINPFVLILSNPQAWQQEFPGCLWQNGDINADGFVDFGDINPFVALLVGG
jgi:hypothetical protein